MKTTFVILSLLGLLGGGGFWWFKSPLGALAGLFLGLLLIPLCLRIVNQQLYNGNTAYGETTDLQVKEEESISRTGRL